MVFFDNCSRQNRNRFVAAMYVYAMHTLNFDTLEHVFFLEKGHTQNGNDSVHSTIERASRNVTV